MIVINNIVSFSDSGPRPNQEDYIVANDNNSRIFVLCDGMGGHGHGEVASATVANAVYDYLTEVNALEYTPTHIQCAVDFAMQKLQEANTFTDEKPMGTTLVVVAVNKNNVLVGHIGDSRCYQFDADGIKKYRSKDHSKVQEAVDAEILTEEEAWNSPKKNILTRCMLSSSDHVEVDVDVLYIGENDILMICSDGVTDALQDSQLQSLIIGRNPAQCAEVINAECSIASRDNFSYIIISMSQDEPIYRMAPKKPSPDSENIPKTTRNISGGYCNNCGSELSVSSKFCPVCGKPIHSESTMLPGKPQTPFLLNIKKWLSEINPFLLIAGGAVIGGTIVALLMPTNTVPSPTAVVNKNTTNESASDLLPEPLVTDFMTSLCKIDSLKNPIDSVMAKSDILSQYQDFLDEIHKK